jgi:hypothetical protein
MQVQHGRLPHLVKERYPGVLEVVKVDDIVHMALLINITEPTNDLVPKWNGHD